MKKILSLATVFALSFTLFVANAQDQPKTTTTKVKSSCCPSSKTAKSGDCGTEAKTSKKMASKHDCGDKCSDEPQRDCKFSKKPEKNEASKK